MSNLFFILFFTSFIASANPADISVQPIGLSDEEHRNLKERVLLYPNIQSLLRNKTFRVLTLQTEDSEKEKGKYYLNVYRYSDNKMFEISGPLNQSTLPQIREMDDDMPASPEEFEEAVKILTEDPEMGHELRDEKMQAYEPMPTTTVEPINQQNKASRLINVGMLSVVEPKRNEIVAVDLHTKKIFRFPGGAPSGAIAIAQTCGLPNARQATTAKGVSGSAEIEIRRGSQLLWKFTVVRPSASSGRRGSGLELRNLHYRGHKVLTRAHTPILNVQYEGDRCGPFRDWTYSENPFVAEGTDRAPGIRISSSPPQTIFDTQQDRGNFRGVAIYSTEGKVLLVTEMSAAWYRYVSKFELYDDGTIKPLFEFSSVENSCVCFSHNHHVYWRFDFDIAGIRNSVQVSNGTTFRPLRTEVAQVKNSANQFWQISNPQTAMAYNLAPGPHDGAADPYSIADVWLLRYSSSQIDDSAVRTSTRAGLNAFLSGGSLINQDLVFWYAGHFMHSHGASEGGLSTVGPTLKPVHWPLTVE